MRKAILLLAAVTLLVTGCNGNSTPGEVPVRAPGYADDIRIVCVNGYQFLLVDGYREYTVTQVWERTYNGPQPAQCQPTEKSTTIETPQPRNTQ